MGRLPTTASVKKNQRPWMRTGLGKGEDVIDVYEMLGGPHSPKKRGRKWSFLIPSQKEEQKELRKRKPQQKERGDR